MKYWLVKSEPGSYSIDDLKRDGKTIWDGVRNYQARNFMRDEMKVGDQVLFYHSNTEVPAIVGLAEVSSGPQVDPTAFDKTDSHFDPKSNPQKPTWILVEIKFVRKFTHPISLSQLKADSKFKDLMLTQKGSRLSVQPVSQADFEAILNLTRTD
jgi:predicted RNA-binding protein with PUA-like domain